MSEGSNKIQELVLDGDEGQVTFTLDDHGLVVEVFQQNFLSETIRRGDVPKLIAWLVINVKRSYTWYGYEKAEAEAKMIKQIQDMLHGSTSAGLAGYKDV